jgi:hypothetical protein
MMEISKCWITAHNRLAYRCGHVATIIGIKLIKYAYTYRPCYHVQFKDGKEDYWPVYDEDHQYEFFTKDFSDITTSVFRFPGSNDGND